MKAFFARCGRFFADARRLLVFCYAAFFALSLLAALYSFAEDRVQRALGNVTTQQVTAADFDWTDLTAEGSELVTASPDPRMILRSTPAYVRGVQIRVTFENREPGEFCIFYKPRPDMEDFDANYRVWAHIEADGSYTFALPRGRVYGLRLDPGIYTGIRMKIESITLNPRRSFAAYFAPTRPWLLAQAALPALIASAVACLQEAAAAGRRRGGEAAV